MVEDSIRIINDLDIQIKDLEDAIKNTKSVNEKIKLSIQKKLLLLQQLDLSINSES